MFKHFFKVALTYVCINTVFLPLADANGDKCDASLTVKTAEEESGKREKPAKAVVSQRANSITLESLAATDESNPILQHPAIVMTAAQKYMQLLKSFPPTEVKDPVFRVSNVKIHPAFTGQAGLINGKMIVGQYFAVDSLAAHIESAAKGDKGGKIFGAVGPSGTGKTEMFIVLDSLRNELARTNPTFQEFTFRWVGLDQVASLKPLSPKIGGEKAFSEVVPDIARSPFTLLRADIQKSVLDSMQAQLENKIGFPVKAWTVPAPKDAEIIEHIFKHENEGIRNGFATVDDLTPAEYIKILSKYVRVVPRIRGKHGTAELVRALGSNPNFERLFVAPNPMRTVFYNSTSPLAWDYTGKIVQQDGGALLLDEAPRNEKEVLDALLEVAQNGVAEADGPPVLLDIVAMFTGNDQSIASAKENGDLNAFLDRSHIVPMRLNLHPYEIMKTAVLMVGVDNFSMRRLDTGKEEKLVPLVLNEAFPLPQADGMLKGIHRRYALYYNPREGQRSEPVLLSPHSLEMLAYTAAMTRIVTEAKEMAKFPGEFEKVTPQHNYFVNPVARLKMMLGIDSVNVAVRAELAKLSALTHEGEMGISARDIQSWMKEALKMASQSGLSVVTPEVIDSAFKTLLDNGTITVPSNSLRTQWLNRYSLVKIHFVLPALHRDLQEIISGHGQRAERLYDTIVGEIIALGEDSNASTWQPDNQGTSQPINKDRLDKVKKKFLDVHGRPFSEGFLMRHLQNASTTSRHPELLSAIEAYITETETDIVDAAREIINFNSGENVSPEAQRRAAAADARLSSYGYDPVSFKAALTYFRTLEIEARKAQQTSDNAK